LRPTLGFAGTLYEFASFKKVHIAASYSRQKPYFNHLLPYIGGPRFRRNALHSSQYPKINAELPPCHTRLPDGLLKTISDAKTITGEVKFKPQFNFVVRTVPMLLCNNVPSIADLSYGMLRRIKCSRSTGRLPMLTKTRTCSHIFGPRKCPAS
jgi:hypothetical protein